MLLQRKFFKPHVPYQWIIVSIVWLSGAVYFLNYMTIGTLAPFIKADLALSSAQVGLLCSAVTVGSMVIQIPAGILCDVFTPGWVIALGLGIIGGSAISVSVVHSYIGAHFLLILLGLGVGCNQAPASKAIVIWFPSKGRATAMGIKQTGIAVGGVIASVLLPAIALQFDDWRYAFRVAGILSFLAAVLIFLIYKEPLPNTGNDRQTISFRKDIISYLLLDRDFRLICLTGIFLMIVQYCFSTYYILYANTVLNIPIGKSGILLALSFGGGAFGRVAWSVLSDYVFGGRRRIVQMIIGIVGAFAAAAFIPLGAYDFTGLIYFLTIVFGVVGLGWNAIFLTIAAEFPEKKLAGTATGIVFLISNLGVIVGPPLFGFLIDLTGTYTLSWLFVAMCMVMVASLSKARRKECPPSQRDPNGLPFR